MEKITYEWIRSNRSTIAIQIREDGSVRVRSPHGVTRTQVERFLEEKRDWIKRHQEQVLRAQRNSPAITEEERREGIALAKERIPVRVAYFAKIMGVTYGRITIREQKTRWGSCSEKGNLNFNWQLILMSEDVMDYVIVHELAHRIEMNHSRAFWSVVERVLPDYRERRRRLKEEHVIL